MPVVLDFQSLFSSLNWQQPSWDLFVIVFFVVSAFIYGLSLGRERIILNIISIYISLALVQNVPFLYLKPFAKIPESQHFIVKLALFLFILIVLFFLFSRSSLLTTTLRGLDSSWWQVLLLSLFQVGLLLSVALDFLPAEILSRVSPLTQQIFTGQARHFWLVATILVTVFMRDSRPSLMDRY